ncbi:MAG: repressor LexA [Dehalococcoidia bacterium]|nr:repressor LexA [Dehalococcoidia bacterium]
MLFLLEQAFEKGVKVKELSAKQSRILNFLHHFLDDNGYPPTIRDIAKGCKISSTSVVDYNLRILEREGYIRRDREVSRGIELGARRIVRVPVIGSIAAGEPIPVPTPDTWSSEETESLELTEELTRGKEGVYALEVKGTSMIDALIGDGDLVLMQQVATAENGEMVAVWLKREKEATLKRFYLEPGRVRLQPANEEMPPIYADPENVAIQGKVIGVIRRVG